MQLERRSEILGIYRGKEGIEKGRVMMMGASCGTTTCPPSLTPDHCAHAAHCCAHATLSSPPILLSNSFLYAHNTSLFFLSISYPYTPSVCVCVCFNRMAKADCMASRVLYSQSLMRHIHLFCVCVFFSWIFPTIES